MTSSAITPIRMPKWGLSMQEGKITGWLKSEGAEVREGEELVDVETSKITNIAESPSSGILRRIVAKPGETLPVGALIGVLAPPTVEDAAIDAFVAEFDARLAPEDADGADGGLALRMIRAGDVSLRVGSAGERQLQTPALLLHGFGGDLENWTLVMGPLAQDRPVFALDLPGHGQSQKQFADARVAAFASAVQAAMDALSLSKVHLVGHSWGGAIALAVALAAPERIASLSLVCSLALPAAAVNKEYLDGFVEARRARELQRVAEMLFADKALVTGELVDALLRYKRLDGVEEGLRAIRDAIVETDETSALARRLAEVAAPLLIIAAHNDEVVSPPDRAALPEGATFLVVDAAGHLPQIERAEDVVQALREHMKNL